MRACSARSGAGSSPHTRGAPGLGGDRRRRQRIIPAYAGSTSACRAQSRRARDHPRIRGEHRLVRAHADEVTGSSPHTRGAHLAVGVQGVGDRIIPAYAGSTRRGRGRRRGRRDHPRIRGEHEAERLRRRPRRGSSPHTRGAHEGETMSIDMTPDHPRIRGEHVRMATYSMGSLGSSPHTRGAPGA